MVDDNNIVALYPRIDGKMTTYKNLPQPGSVEWSRLIFEKYYSIIIKDHGKVKALVRGIPKDKLEALPLRLTGNILNMLVLKKEDYLRNKTPVEAIIQNDKSAFDFAVYVLADLFVYLNRQPSLIEEFYDVVSAGQIYRFYTELMTTCTALLNE